MRVCVCFIFDEEATSRDDFVRLLFHTSDMAVSSLRANLGAGKIFRTEEFFIDYFFGPPRKGGGRALE